MTITDEQLDDEGTLADLPRDEYLMVLGYLSPTDKKNLKLASETCERRVMALDPNMRRWAVSFEISEKNITSNLEKCLDLRKAKVKHSKNGIFDELELKLYIDNSPFHPYPPYYYVINNWKNNIVQLKILLSGHEWFLMDPAIKLPSLKMLYIGKKKECESGEIIKDIASTFIENQAESLEILHAANVDFDIKQKINLKKFVASSHISSNTIVSVLNSSKESLKSLELMYLPATTNADSVTSIPNDAFVLERFYGYGIGEKIVFDVLKRSSKTLKELDIRDVFSGDETLDYDFVLPKIEKICLKERYAFGRSFRRSDLSKFLLGQKSRLSDKAD